MSAPKRFFGNSINYPEDSETVLDGEEFIHAKTVLRVTEGTEITLLDNAGNEYSAIVTKVCLLYTCPCPRDISGWGMLSSA